MTATDPAPIPRSRVAVLASRQHDPVFLNQSGATVLLDTDFVIRAATPAYTAVTHRHVDELLSVNVFDAFPGNPDHTGEDPTRRLAESVEEVLRTGQVRYMPPMRYDIPDPGRPGRFLEKRWMIVNTPVLDGGEVIGAGVRGHDLTLVEDHLVRALADYRDALADGDLRTSASRRRLDALNGYLALVEDHGRLAAEVSGLRRALKTRPVIDQAKGIIMADRRCTPDEAFEVLKQLSMDTNVKVADVAAALVYQARRD